MDTLAADARCLCGGTDFTVVQRIDENRTIVKCSACSLARTYPYPQFNFESQEKYSNFYIENETLFRKFARSMGDVIRRHKTSGAFLDIGCSVGYLLDEAQKIGFVDTVGIELNTVAADIARKKGHSVHGLSVEDLDLGREKFDFITFNHVMEHVRDLKRFLSAVNNLLKPDGVIYCGVPNYDSFMRRFLGTAWYGWGMPDHIWHFDIKTFRAVMRESGFAPKMIVRNSLYYPYSKSLRKNTRACLAQCAERIGMGDQLYGVFVHASSK